MGFFLLKNMITSGKRFGKAVHYTSSSGWHVAELEMKPTVLPIFHKVTILCVFLEEDKDGSILKKN